MKNRKVKAYATLGLRDDDEGLMWECCTGLPHGDLEDLLKRSQLCRFIEVQSHAAFWLETQYPHKPFTMNQNFRRWHSALQGFWESPKFYCNNFLQMQWTHSGHIHAHICTSHLKHINTFTDLVLSLLVGPAAFTCSLKHISRHFSIYRLCKNYFWP